MSRLVLCNVSGLLTDLLQKLSGEDGDRWAEALKNTLRKENPWSEFKIWRTIERDPTLNSPEAFLSALAAKNCGATDWAKDIIGKPAFAESLIMSEREFDLFVLTTAQLTGKKDATSRTDEIFTCVKRLDFQMCPAWIGPQLRLDYDDQPNKEWFYIAMEPIRDSDGCLSVFFVERGDSGLWLYAGYADPGNEWDSDHCWVVCRPRK